MLAIRFERVGRKNKAQFRIVLQEHTIAPGGRHVAVLGSYDPHQKKAVLKADKIKEWTKKGAQVSDSVYNLLIKENVIEGNKRAIKMKKPEVKQAPAEEKKAEEIKAEEPKEEIKEPARPAGGEVKSEEAPAEVKKETEPKEPKTEEAVPEKAAE